MITLNKNFTKFACLMVAFCLILGLAVTGCSDKDRDGGRVAEMANIVYIFDQLAGVTPKADVDAVYVVMTAFDADGEAVAAEQDTQVIAEHEDITPEALVGSKFYAGVAQVDTTAVKLVLTYLNADGDELSSDVVTNVTIKEDTAIDFTVDEEPADAITWMPTDAEQKIAVGVTLPISVTDADGNPLMMNGDVSAEGYIAFVSDPTGIIGVAPTPKDEPVILTVNALNEAGEVLDTMNYEITVVAAPGPGPAPDVVWSPVDAAQTLDADKGETFTITASNGKEGAGRLEYKVSLTTNDKAGHISVNNNVVTAESATEDGKTVTVTATAKDEDVVVGTMVYKITVVGTPAPAPDVVWSPADAAQTLYLNGSVTLTITASNEIGIAYTVTLTTDDKAGHISVNNNVVTAESATEDGKPVTVTATAKDFVTGDVVGTMEYKITVVGAPDPEVVWSPADAAQTLNRDDDAAKTLTITASNEIGIAYTVTLTTDDKAGHISVNNNVVTAESATEDGKPVTVTATAKDFVTGDVVGTMEYKITVVAAPDPEVVWSPADAAQTLYINGSATLTITASNGKEGEDRLEYTVSLATDDKAGHISVNNNVVTATTATDTGKPVTVTATAKYEDVVVGTMTYKISVVVGPSTYVEWLPANSDQTLSIYGSKTLKIQAFVGPEYDPEECDVSLTTDDKEGDCITVSGNVVTVVGATEYGETVTVTATATDYELGVVGTKVYNITVLEF